MKTEKGNNPTLPFEHPKMNQRKSSHLTLIHEKLLCYSVQPQPLENYYNIQHLLCDRMKSEKREKKLLHTRTIES
jgi:hypothetical protein